jgi:hypothetical protein
VTRLTPRFGSAIVGFYKQLRGIVAMAGKTPRRDDSKEANLPFDVTQEIDSTIADQLRRGSSEPTLTQVDFEDITVVLPQKPKRP